MDDSTNPRVSRIKESSCRDPSALRFYDILPFCEVSVGSFVGDRIEGNCQLPNREKGLQRIGNNASEASMWNSAAIDRKDITVVLVDNPFLNID